MPDELRALFDRYLEHYFEVFIAGHQQRKNTIISRQLAFVILGAVTMYRATGSDHYRQQIGRLLGVAAERNFAPGACCQVTENIALESRGQLLMGGDEKRQLIAVDHSAIEEKDGGEILFE